MKYITSAGVIVRNQHGKILLTRKNDSDFWGFLKGKLEMRKDGQPEQPQETAMREAHEEGGVKYLSHVVPLGAYGRPKMNQDGSDDLTVWKTIIMYLSETEEEVVHPEDPEHAEARWFSISEAVELHMHQADTKFLIEVRNKIV